MNPSDPPHPLQHNPIRPCPCSSDAISCGYHNIDLLEGCPFDCSYCILQGYLGRDKSLKRFSWSEEDLHGWLAEASSKRDFLRLGTGELADSLAFEPQYPLSGVLLKVLAGHPGIILEWKTKSVQIEGFLRHRHLPPNIVVSWSLNPDEAIIAEEGGTPSLQQRLHAMRALGERGVKLGIHLDPILLMPKWRSRYENLTKAIQAALGANGSLAWLSLGTLRFPPSLRPILLERAPSGLFYGELSRDSGGKYRYLPEWRVRIYRHLLSCLRAHLSQTPPIYLCMERREVWEEVFQAPPPSPESLNETLYRAARPSFFHT